MIALLDRPVHQDARLGHGLRVDDAGVDSPIEARTPDVFAAVLDEVDYPMFLIAHDMKLLHANKSARRSLAQAHPFTLELGKLQLQCKADMPVLGAAIHGACFRGLRALIQARDGQGQLDAVAVVPLRDGDQSAALLMLGKPGLGDALSVHGFARENSLTASETRVLSALCAGQSAQVIARSHGVALSTVRTQISSLRAKTGASDIRELLRKVAVLPPLVSALHLCRG